MNAFLRNIEAQRLRERDEQMATQRGTELPKDPHAKKGFGMDTKAMRAIEAAARRQTREALLRSVSLVMDSGRPVAELCAELGLTERQYFQAKAMVKKSQSSRNTVKP